MGVGHHPSATLRPMTHRQPIGSPLGRRHAVETQSQKTCGRACVRSERKDSRTAAAGTQSPSIRLQVHVVLHTLCAESTTAQPTTRSGTSHTEPHHGVRRAIRRFRRFTYMCAHAYAHGSNLLRIVTSALAYVPASFISAYVPELLRRCYSLVCSVPPWVTEDRTSE